MKKTTKWVLIAFAIFCVLFAVGCVKTAVEDRTTSSNRDMVAMSAPMMAVEESGANYVLEKAMPEPYYPDYDYDNHYGSGDDIEVELQIIRTGNIHLEVDDYFLASQKVEAYASKYSGYVSNSDARASHDSKHSGTVTIRVPEIHFDAVMAELSLLGEIKSKSVHGNDVTEEYIDLQARINNSKAHETRLIEMYDDADDINEMMQVERELSRVREQIESWEGRLRYLNNRVQMSTITVDLYEPLPVVKEWGIWTSVKNAVNHSLRTIRWMIEFIGMILPLLVTGTLIWLLVRWLVRRSRRNLRKR